MTAAPQPRTSGPARRGQSRFAPLSRTCRRDPSRWTARPANRLAGQKTAPGIFLAPARKTHQETVSLTLGTHQESGTYGFVFAPGCAVAPNSGYDAVCNLSFTRDGSQGSSGAASLGYILSVTNPDGSGYCPVQQVKSAAMAAAVGAQIGDFVPMYVPADFNPQTWVDVGSHLGAMATDLNSGIGFPFGSGVEDVCMYAFCNNDGPLRIKYINPAYDGAANFVYGAMATAAGYTPAQAQLAAGAYRTWASGFGNIQYSGNTVENYNAIQAGIQAQQAGARITTTSIGGR